jgi:DNA invertase Pin-like site-specific DNA recombinase
MPSTSEPLRVVLYARVSTILQEDPEAQIEALERVGATRQWVIVDRLIERASGADRKRPELARAVGMLRAGRARAIAAVSLDRITRSAAHLFELLAELGAYAGELICVRDGELDTTTPTGRAFLAVRAVFAELERDLARERAREHVKVRKARGLPVGRPRGLAERHLPELVELRRAGATWSAVARHAAARGWGTYAPSSVARTVSRAIAASAGP